MGGPGERDQGWRNDREGGHAEETERWRDGGGRKGS